jgi:predicted dehydrogenase
MSMDRRVLNVGLVGGGGKNAFFVHPHERGIFMDGTRRVACGALRSDRIAAIEAGEQWPYPIRTYGTYMEMLQQEKKLPPGDRMHYVLVVTPNHKHYDPAMCALQEGYPVFCEKPLAMTFTQASDLQLTAERKNIPFAVAHTYLGHWSTQFARFVVTSGLLGDVRRVSSNYMQGWLADRTEDAGVQQAEWRVDPKRAGISGCGGDIGTHAYMQTIFVTGLGVKRILYSRLTNFVEGRKLDDNFTTICEMTNGAEAHICATQIAVGHKNDLQIEVNGTQGSLICRQEESEKVTIYPARGPERTYWRGTVTPNDGFLRKVPKWLLGMPTLPPGHGEAFHDALARLHRCFEIDVRRFYRGLPPLHAGTGYASVEDGVRHMHFLEAAVESSCKGQPIQLIRE